MHDPHRLARGEDVNSMKYARSGDGTLLEIMLVFELDRRPREER